MVKQIKEEISRVFRRGLKRRGEKKRMPARGEEEDRAVNAGGEGFRSRAILSLTISRKWDDGGRLTPVIAEACAARSHWR